MLESLSIFAALTAARRSMTKCGFSGATARDTDRDRMGGIASGMRFGGELARTERYPPGAISTTTGAPSDPAIKNLVVRDRAQYPLAEPCDRCHGGLAGPAIDIRDGFIRAAWLLRAGELAEDADIYVTEDDGSLRAMPEWNDHAMACVARDC